MRATHETKARNSSSAPPTFTPTPRGFLQSKCACGGTPGPSGECESCRKKKLQRRSENPDLSSISHPRSSLSEVPPIVHEVLRSPGQPLDSATHAFMEPRFGHDFSKVKVETTSNEPQSVEAPGRTGKIVQRPVSADASSSRPDSSPAPTAEAAGSCEFSINYENRKDMKCHEIPGYEGQVGAAAVYDITGVTATGSGCPRTLDGLRLTETIKSDGGCSGQSSVERGEGCVITSELGTPRKGKLNWCQDTYAICGPSAGFPTGQCTEQFTQQTFIGGSPAETRQITFRFFNDGTSVFGLLSRT